MTTPQRFGDNKYKNWLKCSHAFIRSKESLHPFVDTEVKKFHADIQQQIGSISGSQCHSCTSKSIQHSRGVQGVWNISCKNNICDRWLQEILRKHDDPKNRNINWKNADIRRWPTDGYEVAKVYMPKGQEKKKKLPEDFDPSAVLSLFKYCKWFKIKVPNTAIVSELIEIRNELFHSGDFKVMDNKKDICIDNTTQLLSDLGINGNVVSELQQLKLEDIDINYRETEVKVFNTILKAVKDEMDSLCAYEIQLSADLNTAQTTITSLQAMQTQQGQEMQESKDKTKQTSEKVVTLETDIKDIKLELKQEKEIFEKMKFFLSNNPDIQDKNISKNIQKIDSIVKDLQCKLDKAVNDISELKTTMEKRMSSVENRQNVQENRQNVLEQKVAEMAEKEWQKQSCLQNDVEGLRVELLSRYGPVSSIPISFLDEEERYLHEILYTDTVINNKGKERNKDQTTMPFKHLFKGRQRIILTGPSGSGKSTFFRKIVKRWCDLQKDKKTDANAEGTGTSNHAKDTWTNNTSITDTCTIADEDLIKYDLLFYINSPEISNETTLIDVLCNQCLKRELVQDQDEIQQKVAKILIHLPEKILMIFDGLDELGHTPNFLVELSKRTLYHEITVLMGMRPWYISRLGLKSTDHFDLYLDIHGFSKDNALRFVKKVFDINNNMTGQKKDANISSEAEDIMLSFKNVPLLLLFLAHILYRDQRLPHKRKDLYDCIIDALIERCLKKTENKHIESNLDQENIRLRMFREKYLNSACKVACHFLLTRKDGVSVVIPQKELIQELGVDADRKLSALLDSGIISKDDFFSPLEKNVSVTFLHMSFQEYLASIHLVQNEGAFQSFLQSLKTLNDVLRHENLFIFLCGLNADHGHKAFIRICQVCDVDPDVQKYRQGDDDDDDGYSYFKVKDDIESLNKMYKACIGEMDTKEPLQIPDIIAQNDEWFKLVISRQSSDHVRSLTLSRFSVIHCEHDLSSLCYLTSLTLWHLSLSEEQSRSLCSSINSFTQLQKLELVEIILTDVVIDLSNLHDLAFFTLKPKLNTNDTTGFINLSACTKLKQLNLHDIRLNEGEVDLKKLTGLTHLTLYSLRKSKECTVSLCNSLSACTKLKKLELNDTALYDGTLDPNALTNLTFLRLSYVSVSDGSSRSLCSNISHFTCLKRLNLSNTDLHDGILDLNALTQLTHLTLVSVTMSKKCSNRLCNSIRSGKIAHLKILELDYITLHDSVLDLMTLTSLTHLELKRLTMCEECAELLCNSLSACTKLKKLGLYDITLHGRVPDLKKLTSLTELILSTLKMSKESTVTLSNSICACTNLKRLCLEHISLHDAVLDLKKLGNLIVLQLPYVTMSNECRKILEESKIHCPELSGVGIYPDKDNWQQF